MSARAAAVAGYTLLDLSRRRLLALFLALEALFVAGVGLAPLVVPTGAAGEERALSVLATLSGAAGPALLLCAIGVGTAAIRNDVDTGAIVAILATPVTRLAYAAGKVAAAALLLVGVDALLGAATLGLLALDGGAHAGVVPWFYAVLAANAVVWVILLLALTVRLHAVPAAALAVALLFAQAVFGELHTLVQSHVIHTRAWATVSEAGYWLLPHPLASDLEREVALGSLRLHPGAAPGVPLAAIPGASGPVDVLLWLLDVALAFGILYALLRRAQV